MNLIDLSIAERGYAPASIALALRTIGACPAAGHRPDGRILCGIGLLNVTPDDTGGYSFAADARCLEEGETQLALLDWLEPQVPVSGAIVSWPNWGSVPRRLRALADPVRHPSIVAAATDPVGRWRDMPRGHCWHLRQARAHLMPCMCPPGTPVDACAAAMPAVLLPDSVTTANALIDEAIAGWRSWTQGFGNFDDADHPAQTALRALDRWRAEQAAIR